MSFFAICIISYLFGSILFGVLIAKVFDLGDLREKGSGNVGATNVMRVGGKRWLGILTAASDGLKGFIPVIIATYFCLTNLELRIIGCLAVIGHMFPIWYGFKGGKGIATFIGMNLALNPLIGVEMCLTWIIMFLIKKISSLSSIVMVTTCIVGYLYNFGPVQSSPIIGTSIIILLKHRKNIVGLLKGTEKSLKI